LRSLFRGKPVILNFVYYNCPSLCGFVLNGLLDGMKGLKWSIGQEFDVLTVSIDPRETPDLALAKKENYLEQLASKVGEQDVETASKGWRFLTGSEEQVRPLAEAVGFRYRWDKVAQEYAHGAGVFVLTPQGKISRTLYGIQYSPKDFKLALVEAGEGKVGTLMDQVLLFCFRYDPSSRGYSLYAFRLVQAGGAGTLFLVGGYLLAFWRKQRKGLPSGSGPGSRVT